MADNPKPEKKKKGKKKGQFASLIVGTDDIPPDQSTALPDTKKRKKRSKLEQADSPKLEMDDIEM